MRDENYIDGMKLPTNKQESRPYGNIWIWQEENIQSLKVLGGYIYKMAGSDNLCFVPDNTTINNDNHKILIDEITRLAMKINKMQNSLREVEENCIRPIRDKVTENQVTFENDVIRLERHREKLSERIGKLEEHQARQIDENRKIPRDNVLEFLNEHLKRIEKLENSLDEITNGYNGTKELWESRNNILGRLEKLESFASNPHAFDIITKYVLPKMEKQKSDIKNTTCEHSGIIFNKKGEMVDLQ